MKLQNIGLIGVLGGLGVVASSMSAQALDFNFSMDINNQTTKGIIQGLNEGVNNNFTIKVLQNPVGLAEGTIMNRDSTIAPWTGGSITVTNGSITSLQNIYYKGEQDWSNILMNYYDSQSNSYQNQIYNDNNKAVLTNNNSTQYSLSSYNITAVPFDFNPAEGAALGIPLFVGLGLLRKKKLAQKSAAKKVAELVS